MSEEEKIQILSLVSNQAIKPSEESMGLVIIGTIVILVIFYISCILDWIYHRSVVYRNGRCPGEVEQAPLVCTEKQHYVEPEQETEDFDIEQLRLELSEVKPVRFDSEGNMIDKYSNE